MAYACFANRHVCGAVSMFRVFGDKNECITVGQETARAHVSVPPGEMRAFSSPAINFKGVPKTSNRRWDYEITEIRAEVAR
jgi:hypothetical protein